MKPFRSGLDGGGPIRAEVYGVPLDLLDMEGTVSACERLVLSGEPSQHVVLNASKVVLMHDDPRLREIVAGCALVSADGQAVVWAGRLAGYAVPERVAGIDLMGRLLATAERRSWPVFFLGATTEVLSRFVVEACRRHPGLNVAGTRDGYFTDEAEVARLVRDSGARLLFVGMPSPRKEYFLAEWIESMGPIFAMGVGGSFDVWAGVTRRAPRWMRRLGLEWFYRFVQEPRRMWRRYLIGNLRFIGISAKMLRTRSPKDA